MDNIRKSTDTLVKDGDQAIEQVRDIGNAAWDKGRKSWKELRGQGQEAMDQAQKNAKEAWADAQDLVQKHPGKAVSLALLVGAAIGAALVAMRSSEK